MRTELFYIKFKNRKYDIEIYGHDDNDGCTYSIRTRNKYASGVIDQSLESIDDYLESLYIFNRYRKSGKTARRWLNKNLRSFFEKFGYNTTILYNSRSLKNLDNLWDEPNYDKFVDRNLKYVNNKRLKMGVRGFLDD